MIQINEERALLLESLSFLRPISDYCVLLDEGKKPKYVKVDLTPAEYEEVKARFGDDRGASFAKTDKGQYFCYTHRCRSKFYDSISAIPMSAYKFVCSTG